jgi:hypothetical protein
VTPSTEALRRCWQLAEEGVLFVLLDQGQPMVEYPAPGAESHVATVRLFTAFEDGLRYREDVVNWMSSDGGLMSDAEHRFKLHRSSLKGLWLDLFEIQMDMNEFRVDCTLELALSEMKAGQDQPTTLDILFDERIIPN